MTALHCSVVFKFVLLCFSPGCLYQEESKVRWSPQSICLSSNGCRVFCHNLVSLACFCLRLDELRHRLIPLYNYDPTEEQEDWGDADKEEDEELTVSKPPKLHQPSHIWGCEELRVCFCSLQEPLYKEGKLALSSAYGT